MSLANCKKTGRPVRLSAMRISVNRKRGVAHCIVYMDGGVPEGDWSCAAMKPYPKNEADRPSRQMIKRWNEEQEPANELL